MGPRGTDQQSNPVSACLRCGTPDVFVFSCHALVPVAYLLLPEFLNSPPDDIRNVDAPVIIHGDAAWVDKLAIARAGTSPCTQGSSVLIELLNVIGVVPHDVNISLAVNRYPGLAFGLNGAGARVSPCGEEVPGVVEDLHATIVGVANDDLIVPVDGDTARAHECCVATALATPLQEEMTVAVEFLDAMIAGVADIHHALSVDCHSGREVELPVAGALIAPLEQEASAAVECLDTVVVIRDVDRSSFVNRDTAGDWSTDPEDELPITIADVAPHREELAATVKLLHALIACIDRVDIPLPICCERRGIPQIVVSA